MKTILYIFSILLLSQLNAQQLKTVYANESKVVALFFPDEIRQAVVGSPNFTFSYNKENPQQVGLLQGVRGSESNLLVITAADEVFSYVLKYRKALDTLSYFVKRKERIGFEKSAIISPIKNDMLTKIDSTPTNFHKIDSMNRLGYFEKFSKYHLKHNRNSLKKKRKQGIVLKLKNLIYNQKEVYALIEIKNKSKINFAVDYLKIFKVNGNSRRKSSYQKVELKPVYSHKLPKKIGVGERRDFVMVVPKYTLGDNEKIKLELKEYRGSRIVQLVYD